MAKLKVRSFGMTTHMKFDNGHSYVYAGYLDEPGHPMDGKQILRKVWSPKNGKAETEYMVVDGTEKPPTFTSLILLMSHYKLKPMQE